MEKETLKKQADRLGISIDTLKRQMKQNHSNIFHNILLDQVNNKNKRKHLLKNTK